MYFHCLLLHSYVLRLLTKAYQILFFSSITNIELRTKLSYLFYCGFYSITRQGSNFKIFLVDKLYRSLYFAIQQETDVLFKVYISHEL